MSTTDETAEQLLTPSEVATRFRVDPKTVTRWANAGKISSIRTLGGHRRFRRSEVEELLIASGLHPEGHLHGGGEVLTPGRDALSESAS